MLKYTALALVFVLAACGHKPNSPYAGLRDIATTETVWCAEPLTSSTARGAHSLAEKKHAYDGYIYALAGVIAIQESIDPSIDHFYTAPARLEPVWPVEISRKGLDGFKVSVFKLYDSDQKTNLQEVIVAFAGSDQLWDDWVKHNLGFSKSQHTQAEVLVKYVSERFEGTPITVTGFSLGGALAAHVTHKFEDIPEKRDIIKQAWLFNSHAAIRTKTRVNKKIYSLALKGEIAGVARRYGVPLTGWKANGAPGTQTFHDIQSLNLGNTLKLHSRWHLMRTLLHSAVIYSGDNPDTTTREPLEILKSSNNFRCMKIPDDAL
ncbi:MAG: hypothetical protein Alpg2KO_00690 [Alphaproteobacteria bacterium]